MGAQVDVIIFESFFSSSKKVWVTKTQVAQYDRKCTRYSTAWPGELAKLFFVCFFVGLAWQLFKYEFEVRGLCWQCARECTLQCSAAFAYCDEDTSQWRWLHKLDHISGR